MRRGDEQGATADAAGASQSADPGKSVCALSCSVSRRLNRRAFARPSVFACSLFLAIPNLSLAFAVRRCSHLRCVHRVTPTDSITGPARLRLCLTLAYLSRAP
jgi:hypothetical protein